MTSVFTRRRLIKTAGAALAVGFLPGCASFPVIPRRPAPDAETAMSWIKFDSDHYVLILPRAEMGQNIMTALQQIACDELGITPDELLIELHSTDTIEHVRATVGSESIMYFALPLASACATLREAMAQGQTSGILKAREYPIEKLRSLNGRGHWVGRSPALVQGTEIVTGQPIFASDVRLPGMVYGRVLRAPVSPEIRSSCQSLDEKAARAVPGFIAIVTSDALLMGNSQGIGIVASTPASLDRIEAALGAEWTTEEKSTDQDIAEIMDIDRRMARSARRDNYVNDDAVSDGTWDVDMRIDIPPAAHASIETRVAVSQPRPEGGIEIWVGSQDVFYQRDVICRRLGFSRDQVVVHACRIGGGFGGKTISTVELESAVLANAVQKPVKVQWTRTQELLQAFHRPPSSHRVRARMADQQLDCWTHDFSSSHILFTAAVVPAWLQRLTDFIGDDGVARGAALPYRANAWRTGFDLVRLPVQTGPWRGLGAGPNCFVIESVIDECARVAGLDPVEFRLRHIVEPRLRRVLEQAIATAPQEPCTDVGKKCGRGVACGIYKNMSYAAVVADVEVDASTGEVRVRHMHCAHDCGLVVNPDQVRAQCEGNIVWGLGMVLVERWTSDVRNFGDSPIPRISDLPSISVHLVDSGESPSGAGETAIVASGAAIANALRAAIGWRASRLPIRSKDVLNALQR